MPTVSVPVLARPVPALKRRANGLAYSAWRIGGVRKFRYFGVWGTKKASDGYAKFRRQWLRMHAMPTDAKPGTEEKINVLASRLKAGLPLYHRDDATL